MDHLDAFCKERELKINVEKTDIQQAQKVPTFNMGNLTIESDTQYKYLGIIIFNKLRSQTCCHNSGKSNK